MIKPLEHLEAGSLGFAFRIIHIGKGRIVHGLHNLICATTRKGKFQT